MATPLVWRGVDAPDLGRALLAQATAGNNIRESFRDLGQVFIDANTRGRQVATDRLLTEAAMAQDLDALGQVRSRLDPNNRMVNAAQVADALTKRGTQIRTDRSADMEYGVNRDRIDGAPTRLAALVNAQERGDISGMPEGDAAYLYLDSSLDALGRYRTQQNNERDFNQRRDNDAATLGISRARLGLERQRAAREEADASAFQRGITAAREATARGMVGPEADAAILNSALGSIRNPNQLAGFQAGLQTGREALTSITPDARRLGGDAVDNRGAFGMAASVAEQNARRVEADNPGISLLRAAEGDKDKSVSQLLDSVDYKSYPGITRNEIQTEMNRLMKDHQLSVPQAFHAVVNSFDGNWNPLSDTQTINTRAATNNARALRAINDDGGEAGIQGQTAAANLSLSLAQRQLQTAEARLRGLANTGQDTTAAREAVEMARAELIDLTRTTPVAQRQGRSARDWRQAGYQGQGVEPQGDFEPVMRYRLPDAR